MLTPVAGGDSVVVPLVDSGAGPAGVTFTYLAPGDYSVSFQPPMTVTSFVTDPGTPATVTVVAGQVTHADFTLSSVVLVGG